MKLKSFKLIALAILSSLIGLTLATPTFAIDPCDASLPPTVLEANGCDNNTKDALPTVVQNILNVIIGITGIIAVIFIIIGGVQYMTSAGDAGKAKKARDTILYAVIGLVVVILAFAIVNFVIKNV